MNLTLKMEEHRVGFLSCLYGSEPGDVVRLAAVVFLSCLYGSELMTITFLGTPTFLSCLYGSERQGRS